MKFNENIEEVTMEKINVAFVTDDNYSKHVLVAIESILLNNYKDNSYHFFIFNIGISEGMLSYINDRYIDRDNIEITFVKMKNKFSNYNLKTHVSQAAFAKIFIADLINCDRIIYLDSDLIVNKDLHYLWKQFEEGVALKAVWNPFYNYDNPILGLSQNKRTFNSGVMLLNLSMMRQNHSSYQLQKFLDDYNDYTVLHDQAAFNYVFKDTWKELPYSWNLQNVMLLHSYNEFKLSKNTYIELYNNPAIIHFSSNSKPWQFRNGHPYRNIYRNIYRYIFGKSVLDNDRVTSIALLKKIKEIFMFKKALFRNWCI